MPAFGCENIFTQSVEESPISVARFPLLDRVHSQMQLHDPFSQFDVIHQVIGRGLRNPGHACYINAFLQVLFHILRLRLLILA
jgi:ubiquitin C-terminal hydrolase